ncbi:Sapep family Mn(2+)-dependent dipeptidase [Ruminococcaceae bacterium OttesenSCG-928-D13]|nr:Sapep family Mn(2+)-dependent dipeptidase [Ruminococcaceae bacterium OttesenSCG-928-D13]
MDEKQLVEQIDAFIKENERAIVADIAKLVAVPSISVDTDIPGKPYGENTRAALDAALEIARRFGLETNDGEGYVGWAELPGSEAGHLATVTHVDVVPEGEGWTGHPFELAERDGWLIGRGVVDDKGPSVLCLYIAKFLKEQGIPLRYGFRVLLGCNEERGMSDVKYYLAHHEAPLFAFSPDASFPVCNGEKGLFNGIFHSGELDGSFAEFDTGLAANVIAAKASCLLNRPAAGLPETEAVTVADEGGKARLTAVGIGGHAASPAGTKNAIGVLVAYLLENKLCTERENAFLTLLDKLHSDPLGGKLGIACKDEMFRDLTVNGGVMKLVDGKLHQSVDSRYPTVTTGEALSAALSAEAEKHGATFELLANDKPFYIPADSAAIKTLLDCYSQVTGEDATPFTMGGGTYARQFPRAVSYGPSIHGDKLPDFAGPEHAPNEGGSLARLLAALKIYILAICRLQSVDF